MRAMLQASCLRRQPGSSYYELPRSTFSLAGRPIGLQQLLLAVVCLFLVPFILFASVSSHHRTTALRPAELAIAPKLTPSYEYVDGTEYVWQIPTDSKPKAVLFLAHGCQCRSTFFWDKHPQCLDCTGMPEERTLVLNALARYYAVVAVSSTGVCWSSSVDNKKVLKVLRNWISKNKLDGLPVFGLGASSGGYFISVLAVHFKFHALVIEISSGRFAAMDINSTYPPTLFVHMPRDKGLAQRISEARDLLSIQGVRNDEVLCSPLRVTADFFSERIPDLSKELSRKIVATLYHHGFLVSAHKALYMKADGRQPGWKMALRKENVLFHDDDLKWEQHLQEEMNVAYAYHEFTSLPSQQVFHWFDSSVTYARNSQDIPDTKVM